jgi:hypothetical protein
MRGESRRIDADWRLVAVVLGAYSARFGSSYTGDYLE